MSSNDCLRLCGGTFFILMTRAMKEHGRTSGNLSRDHHYVINPSIDAASISQRNVLKGLVKIFYPSMTELAYTTEKSNATNYKKCNKITSIPFDNAFLREAFDGEIKRSYDGLAQKMSILVDTQIDAIGKGVWLVKALLELIEQDRFIPDDKLFYVVPGGKSLTKQELRSESRFCLETFLLGIWHYCVLDTPDNTVGAETYLTFYPLVQNNKSSGRREFVSSIGQNLSRYVELVKAEDYNESEISDAGHIEECATNDGYYDSYLHSVLVDISEVNTILSEETINFRDFYVCNGLYRRYIRQTEIHNRRVSMMNLDNPNIESIREIGLRIIIQGTGGMGKSMLMRHFMLDGIERCPTTGRIPILIRLKDYARSNYDIIDFIFDSISEYYPGANRERINRDIADARLVLLLDGLDEINSAYRGQFETRINRFLAVNDQVQVVLSTRQFSKDVYVNNFKICMLLPLTKEKALELVDKLPFRPHDPSKKENFRKALDERLYHDRNVFARNPLLLTFMLMTYERFGGEETSMHTFYAEVYELLSTRHDSTKEGYNRVFKTGLRPERLRDIFAAFCAITYQREELDFSATEIVERFRGIIDSLSDPECYIDPYDIVEDITSGVCMLYREGDRYYFHHRSFQEYFCALSFSKQSEEKLKAIGYFFERRSHERGDVALQMLCGIIPEKTEKYIFLPFLETLLGQNDESGYWSFLQKAYPYFYYDYGKIDAYSVNESASYVYSFILSKYDFHEEIADYEMPFYQEFIEVMYAHEEIDGVERFIEISSNSSLSLEMDDDYIGTFETSGYTLYVQTEEILQNKKKYIDLIHTMTQSDFPFMIEYQSARRLMMEMQKRAKLDPQKLIDYI